MPDNNTPPILKIQNPEKMVGQEFYNRRFICTKGMESNVNYRFQFEDTLNPSPRYVWVEISKFAQWDSTNGRWCFHLNYPNCPTHIVTSEYISDFRNAVLTMGTALKESLKS